MLSQRTTQPLNQAESEAALEELQACHKIAIDAVTEALVKRAVGLRIDLTRAGADVNLLAKVMATKDEEIARLTKRKRRSNASG